MMLINVGVHQWLKSEYMQLINKNEHAGVAIYDWKLHDRSDIGEYGAPSIVRPRVNCPSCPPPLGGPGNRFAMHLVTDWEISLISKVITHPRGVYLICKQDICRYSPRVKHLQMRYKPNGHVTTALLYGMWADQSSLSCVCHEVNFILLVLCHEMVW